jgi:Zn-dependent protease
MSGWWVTEVLSSYGPAFLVSWIVWVVVSITLHELAHGWVAIRLGDQTPIHVGHMTWNPLVHMGPMSFLALALIGIAWGAMPVDVSRLRGRFGEAWMAVAGPAMNVVLALVSCVCAVLWPAAVVRFGIEEPLATNAFHFFYVGVFLNLAGAAFNMIPVPPLDGSRVLGAFSRGYERFMSGQHGQWVGLGLFVLLFWSAGGMLWPTVQRAAVAMMGFGYRVTGITPMW